MASKRRNMFHKTQETTENICSEQELKKTILARRKKMEERGWKKQKEIARGGGRLGGGGEPKKIQKKRKHRKEQQEQELRPQQHPHQLKRPMSSPAASLRRPPNSCTVQSEINTSELGSCPASIYPGPSDSMFEDLDLPTTTIIKDGIEATAHIMATDPNNPIIFICEKCLNQKAEVPARYSRVVPVQRLTTCDDTNTGDDIPSVEVSSQKKSDRSRFVELRTVELDDLFLNCIEFSLEVRQPVVLRFTTSKIRNSQFLRSIGDVLQ
ncbi:hypothetical protein AAG570_012395 [Ranatra chinensis]|uniref:Uncharacterized protein n=1 Tax=Ranatra chinensis TaxID=642074 RepID=A0ABD0Z0X2_9HEMI